jgi:hypothetical protein
MTNQTHTIDFDNLNRVQKMNFQRLVNDSNEKRNRLAPINEKIKNDRGVLDVHEITERIVLVEYDNTFKSQDEFEQYDSYYVAYVDGKKTLASVTFSKESAIIQAICKMNGDEGAHVYACKVAGVKDI